jgi:hypothetical protein
VWIILLALTPFTQPFSVCHVSKVIESNAGPRHTPSDKDASETWLTQGAELGVEPTTPLASTISASASIVAVRVDATANQARQRRRPSAPLADKRAADTLVLRV